MAGTTEIDIDAEIDELSDEELTRLALAADPNAGVADDALPFRSLGADPAEPLLPDWYMPAPSGHVSSGRRWKRVVVLVVIAAFLVLNRYGLCSTYGWIEIA